MSSRVVLVVTLTQSKARDYQMHGVHAAPIDLFPMALPAHVILLVDEYAVAEAASLIPLRSRTVKAAL